MSLINDALKRTKDVQQQTPPPANSGPALRPADSAQAKSGSGAKTLLFIMVLAVILGNFLLWMAFKDRGEKPVTTTASTPTSEIPQPVSAPPVSTQPSTPPIAAATPTPAPEPAPTANTTDTNLVTQEPQVSDQATNLAEPEPGVVFAEPPKPKVLRLQSIIYGARPSAMIGGKFLFVGDSIQGHQVISIDKETVTLVGEGQTNVLSLP